MKPPTHKSQFTRVVDLLVVVVIVSGLGFALVVTGGSVSRSDDGLSSAVLTDAATPLPTDQISQAYPAITAQPAITAVAEAFDPQVRATDAYPLPPTPTPFVIEATPMPTPRPEDPVGFGATGERCAASMNLQVAGSEMIVIGQVVDVGEVRWSTEDSRRPSNPHVDREFIFRPAVIEVEEYVYGERSERRLHILLWGGTIGQDQMEEDGGRYELQQGSRVLLFLYPSALAAEKPWLQDQQFFEPIENYTIDSGGQAIHPCRMVSLQNLRAEIIELLAEVKTASPDPRATTPTE